MNAESVPYDFLLRTQKKEFVMKARYRIALALAAGVSLLMLPAATIAGTAKAETKRSLSTAPKGDIAPPVTKPTKQKRGKSPKKKKNAPVLKEALTNPGLKVLLPDLQVEIADPVSNTHPAMAKVHNKGSVATPASFNVLASIELSCEAGKLVSKVNAANPSPSVQAIPAGSFRYVDIMPANGHWAGGGCYYRVKLRADNWETIKEVNEKNNSGHAHFCPQGGSCY